MVRSIYQGCCARVYLSLDIGKHRQAECYFVVATWIQRIHELKWGMLSIYHLWMIFHVFSPSWMHMCFSFHAWSRKKHECCFSQPCEKCVTFASSAEVRVGSVNFDFLPRTQKDRVGNVKIALRKRVEVLTCATSARPACRAVVNKCVLRAAQERNIISKGNSARSWRNLDNKSPLLKLLCYHTCVWRITRRPCDNCVKQRANIECTNFVSSEAKSKLPTIASNTKCLFHAIHTFHSNSRKACDCGFSGQ